ncbi:MAG: hypothetical protein GC161_09325 [Planctomycetaceae bacterium]|nr:hypothetical protein [Planctomycetaceae bacterium]
MLNPTPRSLVLLLCLVSLLAAPATAREDLRALWAELAHPDAQVRALAERRLGQSLGPEHAPLLAEWALAGDSETRARLASALVHAPRHLGLALALARQDGPAAEVGQQALLGHIAAWEEGVDLPLLARRELDARLDRWADDRRSKRLRLPADLEPRAALELMGRRADFGLPLIVDPELARAAPFLPIAAEPLDGSAVDLLRAIAGARGLALDAAQAKPERENDPPALLWLRLVRAPAQGRGSGAEQLLTWLGALDGGTPAVARASAQALALSGWPAALDLLAERWLARRDPAAEAGLLAAASVGRPHGVLLTEGAVAELVARLDRALAGSDGASGAELGVALAGLPARAPSGADLGAVLAADFDAAPPRAQRARLAALVHTGAGTDPVRALVARVLGAEEGVYDPQTLKEALRVRAGLFEPRGGGVERVGAPRTLLRAVGGAGGASAVELGRWLVEAELLPPEGWRDPAALPADLSRGAKIAVLQQWLGAGDLPAAAAHLTVLMEDAGNLDPLAAHLEPWRVGGDGDRLAALLAVLRQPAEGAPAVDAVLLDDLALALGLLPEERHRAVLDRLLASETPHPVRLAQLVAGPMGVRARVVLVGRMRDALETATPAEARVLASAVIAAERRLTAAGLDGELAELRFALSTLSRTGRETALGAALLSIGRADGLVRPLLDLGREEAGLVR